MIADFDSIQFYFDRLMALLFGLLSLVVGIAAVWLVRWKERHALSMALISLSCSFVALALSMPSAGLAIADWLEFPRALHHPRWYFMGCAAPGFILACAALGMRATFQMTEPPNQPQQPASRDQRNRESRSSREARG